MEVCVRLVLSGGGARLVLSGGGARLVLSGGGARLVLSGGGARVVHTPPLSTSLAHTSTQHHPSTTSTQH